MATLRRLKERVAAHRARQRNPERAWIVTLSEQGVSCQRPNGLQESVAWADLRAVLLETTDAGPFAADIFWILVGEQQGCVIPKGATGETALLERLQLLDGFDNIAVILAMSSTGNQRFLCWQKRD